MLCVLWLCVLPYELMRVGVWGFQWIVCCVLMCRFCLMWWMMLMVIVSANACGRSLIGCPSCYR